MKIDPNMVIGSVTGKISGSRQIAGDGSTFEDILSEIGNTSVKEARSVQASYPVDQLNPQKINALSLSEQALDMLDSYSKGLADPNVSLKSLAPMVEDLSRMRSSVLDAGSFLSDDDPLKAIMNDVASTLNGEVMRFRRGDLTG
ncbi:MAG TPA: hypothetical protein PLA83_10025 [Deltaproteobacteria bacterium]|nr:hypothetical protein [Deltaproteobacteria bacterium]HQI01103.1 hypothetical protein [Deltaproteobacteria bacterium]HQJ10161.1 hypothetical protein [Deltaproteobacteria bacterium]